MTITLVFGKWVKPHFRVQGWSLGICFGFGALTFYPYDYESSLEEHMSLVKERDLRQKQEISDLKMEIRGYEFSKN